MAERKNGYLRGERGKRNNNRNNAAPHVAHDSDETRTVMGVVLRSENAGSHGRGGAGTAPPSSPDSRAHARPFEWIPAFLAYLMRVPNVSGACRAAGISRQYAYEHRDEDPDFAAQWEAAIAISVDDLEERAWKRAEESDRIMEVLLRAHKPALYGDKRQLELTGAGGGPIRSSTEVAENDEEREMLRAAIRRELARRGEEPL